MLLCETSGFRRGVDGLLALLGSYAASIGTQVRTPQDNLLVPSSMAKGESMTLEGRYRQAVAQCLNQYHHKLRRNTEWPRPHRVISECNSKRKAN